MNTLESYKGTIMEEEGECAQFAIDTPTSPFVLSGVTKAGEQYTFSFWVRSDSDGSITTCGNTFPSTTEWTKHAVTYTAKSTDLKIYFNTVGSYYMFQSQLEIGNVVTDYVPAPEDTDDSIEEMAAALGEETQVVRENVASLTVDSVNIRTELTNTQRIVDGLSGEIKWAETKLTALEQTSEQVGISVQNIVENGVDKVTTTTGFTFNESGMEVDKSNSPTKTTVTPDGMKVHSKTGGEAEVLSATSEGVVAKDLHAKTYLIVSGKARFEKYGNDRVGCYWIGGE